MSVWRLHSVIMFLLVKSCAVNSSIHVDLGIHVAFFFGDQTTPEVMLYLMSIPKITCYVMYEICILDILHKDSL